jgi:hypothetical protein
MRFKNRYIKILDRNIKNIKGGVRLQKKWPVVKIIAASLSQHDEKHFVSTPLRRISSSYPYPTNTPLRRMMMTLKY